jgi:hypothetical protein
LTVRVDDPIAIALLVAAAVERAGGEYFVGGSVASSLQGDPRSTNDVDFVISLPLGRVKALVDELGGDFEVDVQMLREALLRAGSANAFYLPLLTKIDFFGLGTEPFDEVEFARRRPLQVRDTGETLVVKAPEDSVLRKLLWFRAGGGVSDKQWRDVVSILRVSGPVMDRAHLSRWARLLGLEDLLSRAHAEAAQTE